MDVNEPRGADKFPFEQDPSSANGEQTRLSTKTHSFSGKKLEHYPHFLTALLSIKKAAARANMREGLLDDELGHCIIETCETFLAGRFRSSFSVDVLQGGGGIAVNMNVNEAIAHLANRHLGSTYAVDPVAHVNLSQSTSDVCATAIRMTLWVLGKRLLDPLQATEHLLFEKAKLFENVRTAARTCLRDAVPTTLGSLFGAYGKLIQRRRESLERAVGELSKVNLGGTAFGSGDGASQKYRNWVLHELNRLSPVTLVHRENLFDAAQNIDDLGQVAAEIKLLSESLIKVSKDLRILSSGPKTGFNEIEIPKVIQGSSFFSGKSNPTLIETLLQCCFINLGNCRTVEACAEHGELQLNVFELAAGISLYDSIKNLSVVLAKFNRHCLSGIRANTDRCEELAQSLHIWQPKQATLGGEWVENA